MVVPVLRILAWLALFGGIVGAWWWYDLYGEIVSYNPVVGAEREQSPVAVAVSLGIAANGLYWCALAHGIATAVEHLRAIRAASEGD